MARDIALHFSNPKPDAAQITTLVEQFIGSAGTIVFKQTTLFITLPGNHSWALQGIVYTREPSEITERWIEVFLSDEVVMITTRQQDEFTNCLADKLGELIARTWKGTTGPT